MLKVRQMTIHTKVTPASVKFKTVVPILRVCTTIRGVPSGTSPSVEHTHCEGSYTSPFILIWYLAKLLAFLETQ